METKRGRPVKRTYVCISCNERLDGEKAIRAHKREYHPRNRRAEWMQKSFEAKAREVAKLRPPCNKGKKYKFHSRRRGTTHVNEDFRDYHIGGEDSSDSEDIHCGDLSNHEDIGRNSNTFQLHLTSCCRERTSIATIIYQKQTLTFLMRAHPEVRMPIFSMAKKLAFESLFVSLPVSRESVRDGFELFVDDPSTSALSNFLDFIGITTCAGCRVLWKVS